MLSHPPPASTIGAIRKTPFSPMALPGDKIAIERPARSVLSGDVIQRAVAGDRAAMQEVVVAHYDTVRNTLARLVGRASDLDDLQQTVFEHVLDGLPRFRSDSNLNTWIGAICVNVVKKHFRRKKYRSATEDTGTHDELDNLPGTSNTEERLDARRTLLICRQCLDTLSPSHRLAYTLRIVMGHSIEETAKLMGAAISTTRLRLYYARKNFAKASQRLDPDRDEEAP